MNNILVFTYQAGMLLVIALVIGLAIFLTRHYQLGWRLFWIGAALFVIAQILHIPFNILLDRFFDRGWLPVPPEQYQLVCSAVILGLSAGLFEEITRYVGLRWWAKDARSWSKGLLFGNGWGGIEALLLVLVMLLNYIIFMALRTVDLSTMLPPEQLIPLQQGLEIYWGVNWYDSLLGPLERMLVLPAQMALTIMVLQVFLRGQSRWLWLAIGWHALLNAAGVIVVRQWGAFAAEGVIAIFSVLSITFIFLLRGEEIENEAEDLSLKEDAELAPIDLPPIEENEDTIEGTRYSD